VQNLENKKIAYVPMGDDSGDYFCEEMNKYAEVTSIRAKTTDELLEKLKGYNYVIVGFHRSNANPWKSYNFSKNEIS